LLNFQQNFSEKIIILSNFQTNKNKQKGGERKWWGGKGLEVFSFCW
jgi:hypothetical protein